jgi:hypothetical protein
MMETVRSGLVPHPSPGASVAIREHGGSRGEDPNKKPNIWLAGREVWCPLSVKAIERNHDGTDLFGPPAPTDIPGRLDMTD